MIHNLFTIHIINLFLNGSDCLASLNINKEMHENLKHKTRWKRKLVREMIINQGPRFPAELVYPEWREITLMCN